MSKTISCMTILLLAAVVAGPAMADDSWSLSKLNPFRKKSSTADRARASLTDEAPPSRFPKMTMPSWGTQSHTPKKREEPSTLDKLNQGTKDFFGKTKSVLMPWTNDTKKRSVSKRSTSADKPSFLTSWLPKKEEPPQRPKTVKDFIGQPRPGF